MNEGRKGEWKGTGTGDVDSGNASCGGLFTHAGHLPSLSAVQEHPIVYAVLVLTGSTKCLGKEISQEVVVGSLGEAQLPHVVEVDSEFLCYTELI
jgi:hypothetical protein